MEKEILTAEQIANNWIIWLDALASGEYKKTIGALHRKENVERHCCLGVAQICLNLGTEESSKTYHLLSQHLGLGNYEPDNTGTIIGLNDSVHIDDDDFINMHRELSLRVEELTTEHPEVAPLVRKILAERNT